MELQEGKTPFSDMTFPCTEYLGCMYNCDDRCIYNVAKIQVRIARACYEELKRDEIECYLDSME